MLPATVRPLPGFRFEAERSPLDETLTRMDVALFAGFAASGPIDVPVAVDQVAVTATMERITIDVASARGLVVGDVIRLTFARDGRVAFGAVAAIAPLGDGRSRLTLESCQWFSVPAQTPATDGVATFLSASGE